MSNRHFAFLWRFQQSRSRRVVQFHFTWRSKVDRRMERARGPRLRRQICRDLPTFNIYSYQCSTGIPSYADSPAHLSPCKNSVTVGGSPCNEIISLVASLHICYTFFPSRCWLLPDSGVIRATSNASSSSRALTWNSSLALLPSAACLPDVTAQSRRKTGSANWLPDMFIVQWAREPKNEAKWTERSFVE